jgi:3-hydroxyisobutyrate dehydrogenase
VLDLLAAGPLGGALRRATSTTSDFPIALAAKDLRLARGSLGPATAGGSPSVAPVAEATLRLMAAAPDQQADLATLINLEKA